MLYTVNTDTNNYVLSISHTGHDNIELNLETLELSYLSAYKLIDSNMILDIEKKKEIISQEEEATKQKNIKELKKYLTDTDYITARAFEEVMALNNPLTFIADMIAILIKYSTQYKDVIAQRKIVRAEIEELEKE